MNTEYKVVFDILQSGFDWRTVWCGLIGCVLTGSALVMASAFYRRRRNGWRTFSRFPVRTVCAFLGCGFVLCLIMTFAAVSFYFQFREARTAIETGNVKIVEGPVANLYRQGTRTHDTEHFTVQNVYFEYGEPFSIGFHKLVRNGSPIHETLPVRITYWNHIILKLEVGE